MEEDEMHARVSRFKGAPEDFDSNVETVKSQAIPAVERLPGFQGCYILGDRETGNSIGVFFFDSAESLAATRDAAGKIREGVAQSTSSQVVSVEEFEVLADSGKKVSRTANYARLGVQELDPSRIDAGAQAIEQRAIPAIAQFPGSQGAVFLIDRASGRGMTLTLFDNSQNLNASREQATQLRSEVLGKIGGKMLGDFEEYEITARAETPVGAQA
jgi:hypothetical protein